MYQFSKLNYELRILDFPKPQNDLEGSTPWGFTMSFIKLNTKQIK